MQPLRHLAPVELERAALGTRCLALGQPGQRAPVVQLEQPHLGGGLGQLLAQAPVVEAPVRLGQAQELLDELGVDDQLARVHAALVGQGRAGDAPARTLRADPPLVGHEHVVQLDLVELGLTGRLHERVHAHARPRACR